MTRNRIWILVTTLSLGGLTAPASAQQPSEARIQELIRAAAVRIANGQAGTPGQNPVVPPPSAAPDPRPVVRLSLDDAVKLALDRNLEHRGAAPEPADQRHRALRSLRRHLLPRP